MTTYVTIPELPSGAALTGLEEFEAVQSATSVKVTAQQLKNFATENPSFTTTDSNNNGVTDVLTLTHETSGVPAVGIGTGIAIDTEVNTGVVVTGSNIASVATDVTPSASNFDLVISNIAAGTSQEVARFTSDQLLGIGTSTPQATIHGVATDSATTAVTEVARVSHKLSSSAAAGAGAGIAFALQDSANAEEVTGQISSVATTAFADADIAISVTNSSALVEVARFTSDKQLGINTTTPGSALEVVAEDSSLSSVTGVARFTHAVSGTPAAGIGAAIDFQIETSPTVNKVGGAIYSQSTDLTPTQEDFDLGFATMINGTSGIEVLRLTSDQRLGLNTPNPQVTYQQITADSATDSVSSVMRLTHTTDGTPAVGFGSALDFEDETTVGNNEIGVRLCSVLTDPTLGTEDVEFSVKTMTEGAAATEKLRVGNAITSLVPFAPIGVDTSPSSSASISIGAGTNTRAPIHLTAGTNLSTATAGAMEYDGRAAMLTPAQGMRGLITTPQIYITGVATPGPTLINTGTAATITNASPAVVTTTASAQSGQMVYFTTTGALPSPLLPNVGYYVLYLSATTFALSSTRGGPAIATTTAGSGTHTVRPLGSIVSSGCNLQALTRYMYRVEFDVSKSSAVAAAIQYSAIATNAALTGAGLTQHSYTVRSMLAASTVTPTAASMMSNVITTGFETPVTITAASGAAAAQYSVKIDGTLDVGSTDLTDFNFVIGFTGAPTITSVFANAFVSIFPVGQVGVRTFVGSWTS